MDIEVTKRDKELTVKPIGRLDSATSGDFAEAIAENFTEDMEKLIIDFDEVDFISSKGLRVIVSVYKELGDRTMEITDANASVLEVFRLSGLLKVIKVNE